MRERCEMSFNEKKYFAYAYLGPALVCYVNWAVKDAVKRKYRTLYFITRDGIFLQQIADAIIKARGLSLKTKLIYGSRKAWRIPRTDEEITANFTSVMGTLGGIRNFDEFVNVSMLPCEELIDLVPALKPFKDYDFSETTIRQAASAALLKSDRYVARLHETQKNQIRGLP